MTERLRSTDLALLDVESSRTPMHNATLEVFAGSSIGLDYERLVTLIADRIAFVPRYRQRLRSVPGRLGTPVWVDDDDFDLTYHVRRSALPKPGSVGQLEQLVARIVSRRLDRDRPLWEAYLIEGLAEDKVAILTKSHQILVDGVSTIDIGQVLLDVSAQPHDSAPDDWRPEREPGTTALLLSAVADTVRDPRLAVDALRGNLDAVLRARAVLRLLPIGRRGTPASPVNTEPSEQRRFVTVQTDLEDFRLVRGTHGGTVNDVILATVTGALRSWLMTRAETVTGSRSLRAMVPLSVIDDDLEPTSLGSQVAGNLLNLPVGESSPVVRLHQVSYALKAHREAGRAVAADQIAGVSGFAPTTFHALGARVAAGHSPRAFNLVVTNVPGPQFPLYAAGARMLHSYPVPPLLPGHALAIGVTSYDGGVYFGLTGDRDAMGDLDVLGQCVTEALAELVDSASQTRQRAPRGRKKVNRKP